MFCEGSLVGDWTTLLKGWQDGDRKPFERYFDVLLQTTPSPRNTSPLPVSPTYMTHNQPIRSRQALNQWHLQESMQNANILTCK